MAQARTVISRRVFLASFGAGLAGTALAACAPRPAGPGPHGSDAVQLVYQDWNTEWFPGLAQQMLQQFRAAHPNIRVFYASDPDNVGDKMLVDMQAGTAPDVVTGGGDFFPVWAQKGYLLDLRPFVKADLDRAAISDWDDAQYRALALANGAQYALPKCYGALALYYNKDLLEHSGVDFPDASWSHDDYLQAMLRLRRDRDGHGHIDQWGSMGDISWGRLQVYVNGWGGHFVDPQNPRLSWMARPEALAALSWLRQRMWDDHSMATSLDVQNLEARQAFIQQRVAMVEDGSWALKDILEGAKFRIGVAPYPAGPARKATLATSDGYGIYAGTKYPEAAWELLKFLVSPEYGRAMARQHLLQPARASLVDEWLAAVREQYPQAKDMDLAAFAAGHREGYSVTAEIFANMAGATRLARAAWEQIFTLGQASVDSLKEVSARIEQAQAGL